MPRNHRHRIDRRALLALGLSAGVAVMAPMPVSAQDSGAFLKGETVRIYVGYSPGGGYDAYARMLAPHFEKRTGATVVVENRPGGQGLTALNQLVRVKPDGLTMMMLNGEGAVMSQLIKQAGVAYDMGTVSMLGRALIEQHVLIVGPNMPDDVKGLMGLKRKIKFSATGRTDNLGDYAAVTCEALKLDCQIITGYKGSKEAGLAVMNGEVDALAISEGSGVEYAQGGRAKLIATIGHQRSELAPNVGLLHEIVQLGPDQKWWLDFRLGIKAVGRSIVAPPGVPADRLQHLQRVWREIMTDPAVMAEGARTQRPLKYEEPGKSQQIVRDLLQTLPANKLNDVNEVLLKKYSS